MRMLAENAARYRRWRNDWPLHCAAKSTNAAHIVSHTRHHRREMSRRERFFERYAASCVVRHRGVSYQYY